MSSLLISLLLLGASPTDAAPVDPALHCLALLETEGPDPGAAYAEYRFSRLKKEGWAHFTRSIDPALALFVPTPRDIVDDDAAELTNQLQENAFRFPELMRPFTTALDRWGRAARQAGRRSKSSVRRTRFVGVDAIRGHLEARAARMSKLQAAHDAAPVASAPSLKWQILDDLSDLGLHGLALVFGAGGVVRGFQTQNTAAVVAGLAIAAANLPFIKVQIERLWVFGKQAAMKRGWFETVENPVAVQISEDRFRERVLSTIAARDRSAFVYRGTEAHVAWEQYGPKIPFINPARLPATAVLENEIFARKGQPPVPRRLRVNHDEVLIYDETLADWVLLRVAWAR